MGKATLKMIQWAEENQGKHPCSCKCGGFIRISPYHWYNGIPEHIQGHERRGKSNGRKGLYKHDKETREKIGEANRGKHHVDAMPKEIRFCECACGETFECKINSKRRFISGHNTKLRLPISEETRQKKVLSGLKIREKCIFWKGGITPLHLLIRNSGQSLTWAKDVYRKDNFTCQECGQRGGKIAADHYKTSFSKILEEFLQKYSQFSPMEDKETLLRLASTYEPFWDITNGRTLCEDCHKLTKNFGKHVGKK